MTKKTRTLRLNRETLLRLDTQQLAAVHGGGLSRTCYSCWDDCTPHTWGCTNDCGHTTPQQQR
jgi:hypothetical protein